MPFRFTGFADEAEKTLDGQIATLKEAGWSAIELRLVNGKSICDQTAEEWDATRGTLADNGIGIAGAACGDRRRCVKKGTQLISPRAK